MVIQNLTVELKKLLVHRAKINNILKMIKSKTLSPKLIEWVERRKNALKLRAILIASGGHVMLSNSVVDPESLQEPLRTEAIKYLQTKSS